MLIISKRFLPLFITQFLGAFNDNMLKNSLVILITYTIAIDSGQNAQVLVTIAAGLFILPFFIFSALAGQLADKYNRKTIAKIVKLFEILIMILASLGFIMGNIWFLIAVLFASGVHSAFFGPIKYALLPQHLHINELLAGNAYVEAGTFLAILLGTILGGLLIISNHGIYVVSIGLLLVAVIGYIAACFIPQSPAPMRHLVLNYNLFTETIKLFKYSRKSKRVITAIICISWFWFIGAIFLAQLPTFVKFFLHSEARVVTLFLTIFSVGVGIGSIAANKLLRGTIKTTYVPMATFGMSLFIIDLYFCSLNTVYFNIHGLLSLQQFLHINISWRIMLDLLLVAICGGIYIVPLYSIIQRDADPNYMARIIAANNISNALFMVLAVMFTLGMLMMHKTIQDVFLTMGLINFLMGAYIREVVKSNLK